MTAEWFSAAQLAGKPGLPGSVRGINKAAEREGWKSRPRKAKGGGREYHLSSLPTETQAACLVGKPQMLPPAASEPSAAGAPLSPAPAAASYTYDPEALWDHYERKSDKAKDKAMRALEILNQVMTLVDNGTGITAAMQAVAKQHDGVSWRTIQNWYHGKPGKPGVKEYQRADWLAALVPGYTGRTATAEIDEDAWAFFKGDYLRLEAPTIAACYHRLQRAAKERGWQIPALRTIERRVECEIPRATRVLAREGENALLQLFPAQQRSVADLHALEWINGDGYQHNVFVQWPDGSIERPKTWFWQDIFSRKILAFRTDVTEHTDLIRASFGDLVETYGIPQHVTIDNTRAAANKWMTGGVRNRYRFKIKDDDPMGLFPMLGIQVHWTTVHLGKGHGQAKPIERAFGQGGVGAYVDQHPDFSGAYTGRNPTAKPENYASKAIPVEQFLETLVSEIAAWNAREGRRTEVCNGELSFDQAFDRSYAHAPIRKATDEQRRLWMLAAEAIQVQRDGTVTLNAGGAVGMGRNRYSAPELLEYYRHKVVVRFDPQDLHGVVHVYTLDGRYIAPAACIEATAFGDTEAARSFNRARKQLLKAAKAQLAAEQKMSQMELQQHLPRVEEAPTPMAKVVRPVNAEPRLGRVAPQSTLSEEQRAEVVTFRKQFDTAPQQQETNDPRKRYQRWLDLEQRVNAGEQLQGQEAAFHLRYPQGDEFTSMQRFFNEFADAFEAEA